MAVKTHIRLDRATAQQRSCSYPPLKSPEQRQYLSGQKTWMFFEHGHVGNVFMRPDKYQLFGIWILAWGGFFLVTLS